MVEVAGLSRADVCINGRNDAQHLLFAREISQRLFAEVG
ncbi:hypothetical protein SanJ4206_1552c [Streptococcus anginosus]|nr:hypothetical protein SanJ4206_1552c [Streptococcus anginosus]ETS94627.1 hypothetical protein HMPREF1512_1449 [Streptococcus sp. OBRC6]